MILLNQTSGELEFGQNSQQSYHPWKPQSADKQLGRFYTENRGNLMILLNRLLEKLEFGQDSQQSYQPWKPHGADQQLEDFTHKMGESDDFYSTDFWKT